MIIILEKAKRIYILHYATKENLMLGKILKESKASTHPSNAKERILC